MGKALYPTQSVGAAVGRLEHDLGGERRGSAALTGNAEFFFEIVADIRNRCGFELIFHNDTIIRLSFLLVKPKKEREFCNR